MEADQVKRTVKLKFRIADKCRGAVIQTGKFGASVAVGIAIKVAADKLTGNSDSDDEHYDEDN